MIILLSLAKLRREIMFENLDPTQPVLKREATYLVGILDQHNRLTQSVGVDDIGK